jgi:GDP-L-fucose synthase
MEKITPHSSLLANLLDQRIYVAGHRGMVGSAIVRQLRAMGCRHLLTRTHRELDLTDQRAVREFFAAEKIDRVVLAAAKVGGIHANNVYPAEFITVNLQIEVNIIDGAHRAGVEDLLFLGSSCIYPKFATQPMDEGQLLTGILEPTNEPYAVAKIAGIKLCEAYNRQYGRRYRSAMPTNLFGPGDNYHLENSHVIPAMIRKYHLAKLASQGDAAAIREDENRYGVIPEDIAAAIGYNRESGELVVGRRPRVVLWGSGSPRREFLHVDDMAAACLHLMALGQEEFLPPHPSFVNVGTGSDLTIREAAEVIAEMIGFTGETVYNPLQPDGTPRKLLDTARINALGWRPKLSFREGLADAYRHYLHAEPTS